MANPRRSERAKAVEVFTFKVAQANEVALFICERVSLTSPSPPPPRKTRATCWWKATPERIAEARAAAEYFEQQITGGRRDCHRGLPRVKYADLA